jgi:cytochrome d ubiquinol oxidase subunit I
LKFGHQLTSGYVVGAFFVMGVSAWHLLRKNSADFFKRSFRIGATFGLASVILSAVLGDLHAVEVAKTQPTKFAAMESIWETKKGVGLNLLLVPDPIKECNTIEQLCIPNAVSLLAFHTPDAEIKGLKEFPQELRPPVLPTFLSFRAMVGLGTFFILAALLGIFFSLRGTLEANPLFLRIMVLAIPLPYIANQLGWVVAEVGRQPWLVYGIMKTSDGVSRSLDVVQVVFSLLGFTLLYGALGVIDIYLLAKYARKGPDDDLSGILKPVRQEA